jgi:hypothetical protein
MARFGLEGPVAVTRHLAFHARAIDLKVQSKTTTERAIEPLPIAA